LGGDTSSKTILYKDPINAEGKITVKQVKLLDPPAQSSDFLRTLQTLFQGWEFNPVSIDGRFEIVENQPYYISEPNFPDEAIQVGAKFELNYLYQIAENGVSSSFHNNLNNLHWIQRVTNYNFLKIVKENQTISLTFHLFRGILSTICSFQENYNPVYSKTIPSAIMS
jgi:hypothetical protein